MREAKRTVVSSEKTFKIMFEHILMSDISIREWVLFIQRKSFSNILEIIGKPFSSLAYEIIFSGFPGLLKSIVFAVFQQFEKYPTLHSALYYAS